MFRALRVASAAGRKTGSDPTCESNFFAACACEKYEQSGRNSKVLVKKLK
ncbi:MAG: hypothetical protein ABSE90_10375 [Verrucomicrobiota bacterium]|jgi:hypothetical protein